MEYRLCPSILSADFNRLGEQIKILEKEDAYPLAKALLNVGIDVIEVTYRSEHATSAIQTISEQLPDMLVGAGTVLSVEQAKEAVEAGDIDQTRYEDYLQLLKQVKERKDKRYG